MIAEFRDQFGVQELLGLGREQYLFLAQLEVDVVSVVDCELLEIGDIRLFTPVALDPVGRVDPGVRGEIGRIFDRGAGEARFGRLSGEQKHARRKCEDLRFHEILPF